MTIDEEDFKRKTEREIKNYDSLRSIFSKLYDIESELKKKRVSSFEDIAAIEENDNDIIKDLYTDFTDKMKDLEEYRQKLMDKINGKIIPATKYYSSQAKKEKKDIGNYKEKKKENSKQQYELEKAKVSRNDIKESQLKDDIEKSRIEINDAQTNLQKTAVQFEWERIINIKYIILHFIHCEMTYHAKSVEKLSKLYQTIKEKEPDDNMKNFAESFKFQSVDPEEYGYDEKGAIKRSRIGKSSINKSLSASNSKSLKVSGLGVSKKGMLEKNENDLENIDEVEEEL
jgi:hypothetical protein